ncbi:MAG: ASPIC/UnbV domain-containing protein [Planctomycetota bacterium]
MSQSPLSADVDDLEVQKYLDAWEPLHQSILTGGSFSGRERNCCFLNTGTPQFADISAVSGLNHIEDGRAVAATDWDHDGDLDLWMTNRNGPRLRYFRNDTPSENSSVSFRLEGDPSKKCPRDPAGARVTLSVKNPAGEISNRIQTLYLGDSFISQSSKWLQFGIKKGEQLEQVQVRWPGSKTPETFNEVVAGGRYLLKQGTGKATIAASRKVAVAPFPHVESTSVPLTDAGRLKLTLLSNPIQSLPFLDIEGKPSHRTAPFAKPLYVVFWASWCQPCREELAEIAKANIGDAEVIAMNIESATSNNAPDNATLKKILDQTGFRGVQAIAKTQTIDELNSRHLESIYVRKELPLPVSFLVDTAGHMRVVYKGPADPEQVKQDIAQLNDSGLLAWSQATPFPGRWTEEVIQGDPVRVARIHIQNGNPDDGKEYLNWYLEHTSAPLESRNDEKAQIERRNLGIVHYELGRIAQLQKQPEEAFNQAVKANGFYPEHVPSLLAIISYHVAHTDYQAALPFTKSALGLAAGNPRVEYQAGMVYAGLEQPASAIEHYSKAVDASQGKMIPATNNLAWLLATHPNEKIRNGQKAIELAKLGDSKGHRRIDGSGDGSVSCQASRLGT